MVLQRILTNRIVSVNSSIGRKNFASSSDHFLKYVSELKVGTDQGKVDIAALDNKILLIYFSAGWCATCKEFTPKFKKFYNSSQTDVAVLWISRDKSEAEQKEYYSKSLDHTWMYVPWGKPTREFLKIYKLTGLPSVKLVDTDGTVVEEEVKRQIEENVDNPSELVQKWKKQLGL